MIAVLIDSRKQGSSAKVAVRGASRIKLSGLDGDTVRILFFDGCESPEEMLFEADCELPFASPVEFVIAEHLICGSGRVFVDLLR